MKKEGDQKVFGNLAAALIAAEKQSKLIPRWTIQYPKLTEEDGYQILDHYIQQFQQQGEKLIGYKLGYTSEPMRKQMGIETPCYGYIFDRHITNAVQDKHWEKWVHPKMEPELAVILKKDIPHSLSILEWEEAIDRIYLVAEIVDSRYEHYQFKLPDIIADNNSIGAVIVNEQDAISFADFTKDLTVKVWNGDQLIEDGSTKSVMEHPINALNWLADKLNSHGKCLHKGDFIITGGLTKAIDIKSTHEWKIELYDKGSTLRKLTL
ncbi:2-keto-4-pentenoate hydratase [Bacillus sp. Marseille-P3661]|uniref:2-keto-4-pentenoate hydratase n=1 Tax=Bacillus sp. Marseille-P3661 TaxID=1936234 RepID=UPI000C84C15F|nr:fumarylacetoacetate hydrolase family protein [Bacillus sp. Marseille-P3661]